MKRCSLQWRLTLMTALLVTAACLVLNAFLSYSAVMQFDEMEHEMLELEPAGSDSVVVGIDLLSLYPELSARMQQSKDTFRAQSIAATAAIILISGVSTWFLSGRALKPLRKFSDRMEKMQAQNLSEPLEEPDTRDEIARLTRSFNGMLARLDRAFTAQRQFSANAAHELRTPLAVMQTGLDVLKKKDAPTAADLAEAVRMASEQTGRLTNLVHVLLEMTELQTVQQTDTVSLAALIEEVLCDLEPVAAKAGVTLRQEAGDAVLTGSDTLLYRAVYNLVENAIKYNRTQGAVTVGVGEEDGMAVLRVSDTGIGIAEEHWNDIFEPFIRVDKSRSRAMGGAGLGLALVREIAEQHGGAVRVAASSAQGTEMVLALPRNNPSVILRERSDRRIP